MKREYVEKTVFLIITSILTIFTFASLAITLFGPGSEYRENITKEQERYYVPAEERGEGRYAESEGVLTYDYVGDYTVSGYSDLGYYTGNSSYLVMGGNEKNSTIWNTVVSEDLNPAMELGKSDSFSQKPEFLPLTTDGDLWVFETDFKFMGSKNGLDPFKTTTSDPTWYLALKFKSNDGTVSTLYLKYSAGDDYYCLTTSAGSGELPSDNYVFKIDEWYNLRFEYDTHTHNFTVFVNRCDFLTVSIDWQATSHNEFYGLQMELRGYVKDMKLRLDNTYVNAITEGE